VLPEVIVKLALPSVTFPLVPFGFMTLLLVFSVRVPAQVPFAMGGHLTETGTLLLFTVTVCFGIVTPGKGLGGGFEQTVGLVPALLVAFGVGSAIWMESLLWRWADLPFAGTAPWKDPAP